VKVFHLLKPTFGGLLILLGLFTRPVAFVLAGEMAVAYVKAGSRSLDALRNRTDRG
jgi:uncharacterized membrane protein YphA (DoxX/SURF4 family)